MSTPQPPTQAARRGLAAGAAGPFGRCPGVWYGRRLSLCQRLSAVCAACRSLASHVLAGGGTRDSRSRRCFHRAGRVSSWIPPVGRGSWGLIPLAARPAPRFRRRGRCSDSCPVLPRLSVPNASAGVILDLVGEVGDQFGPLGQVATPNGIGMERWWNARKPGQRNQIGRRRQLGGASRG